jgi:hypothetical protein
VFDHVNWVAVLGAAIAGFAVGAIWHGPLFGKRWAALHGIDPSSGGGPPLGPILVANFVITLVAATALAVLVTPFSADVMTAAFVGALVWVASGLTLKVNDVLFARLPAGLLYIDSIGHLITLVVMAVIVSVFRA